MNHYQNQNRDFFHSDSRAASRFYRSLFLNIPLKSIYRSLKYRSKWNKMSIYLSFLGEEWTICLSDWRISILKYQSKLNIFCIHFQQIDKSFLQICQSSAEYLKHPALYRQKEVNRKCKAKRFLMFILLNRNWQLKD